MARWLLLKEWTRKALPQAVHQAANRGDTDATETSVKKPCRDVHLARCLQFAIVKSVGGTPVQCVDHLVPLCSGTFSFSVLAVGAEWGSFSLECVCFDHLSRTEWNVARSGSEHVKRSPKYRAVVLEMSCV